MVVVVSKVSRQYYVYIMTNQANSVLYTGITSDLKRRTFQHKKKYMAGFAERYNLSKLVYFEVCGEVESAILREKQIKGGFRQKKMDLVNSVNSQWRDLYGELL